jgi:hypothetical protein
MQTTSTVVSVHARTPGVILIVRDLKRLITLATDVAKRGSTSTEEAPTTRIGSSDKDRNKDTNT